MATVGERIVGYARDQLGDPYVWGAEGPDSFDCSGLVYAAYKAAGLNVSRTTAANLGRQGQPVAPSSALPGDVVYYDRPGATDHVGIYIGGGQMIEAQTSGVPVKVSGVGAPTSIRRLAPVTGTATGSPDEPQKGRLVEGESLLDKLNPFDNWASDLQGLALKVLGAGAAAALVIVGAKTALSDRSN